MTRESLLSHLDTVKARPPLVHRHIFLPVSSRRKEEPCPGADHAPGQSTVLFPNPWQRGLDYPSPHLTEGKTEARCWSLHHALPQGGKKSKGQSKQQKPSYQIASPRECREARLVGGGIYTFPRGAGAKMGDCCGPAESGVRMQA